MNLWKSGILAIGLLLFNNLTGQTTHSNLPPPPPGIQDEIKLDFTLYDVSKRKSFYPFNRTASIQLVSFEPEMMVGKGYERNESSSKSNDLSKTELYRMPIVNDTLVTQKVFQFLELDSTNQKKLSDILYNNCARYSTTSKSRAGCYYPHNAILFFDDKNKLIEYVEICFDCHRLVYSELTIEPVDDCDYMFAELQKFFSENQLKSSKEDFNHK